MTYELKDYLKAINKTKEKLMDTDDKMWEKKYPSFIVNKCVAPFTDTIHLVNELNMHHHLHSKLQFDLARKMKLNRVEYLDKNLKTSRNKDAVFVEFPLIKKGENFTFRVYYEGKPLQAKNPPWDGGFVWEKDKKGRPFISVACEGEGANIWWPLKDHIADEPDEGATMTFTVPKELYCVSNGRLLEVLDSPDETKRIFTWTVNNPINNYNISVQLGHYITIKDTIIRDSGIDTLTYYVLDYHEEIG